MSYGQVDDDIAEGYGMGWRAAVTACAKAAETTTVQANGHPQIDAPTLGDLRRAIVEAIQRLSPT